MRFRSGDARMDSHRITCLVPQPSSCRSPMSGEKQFMVISMALSLELIPLTNLLFSALVVIVGLMAWRKTKEEFPLYIAGAFLLFGISHLATILWVADVLAIPLLVIRIIGYVIVIGALYRWYAKGGE